MNSCLKTPMVYVEVAVPIPVFSFPLIYSYQGERRISIGCRVVVPVGKRQVTGIVLSVNDHTQHEAAKIKILTDVLDEEPVISAQQIALSRFVSNYYHASIGEVLKLCRPAGEQKAPKITKKTKKTIDQTRIMAPAFALSDEQKTAIATILEGGKQAFLLQGITGSGKTEIYVQVARKLLSEGKSALLIVPEIALTPNLYSYFSARLATPMVMLHSGLTPAKRRDAFFDLLNRKARVAIGARSALFAPLPDLGLIVVDEEHDSSLKQDGNPRYHGRDVALWRANNENALIILGSATPSLESKHNVSLGKLQEIRLNTRVSGAARLPAIRIIDLKQRKLMHSYHSNDAAISSGQGLCILSDPLKEALTAVLERGEQAMLFLNRRGYAAFAICQDCGEIANCPHCSVSMTYYQAKKLLRCHQCDYVSAIPSECHNCKNKKIIFLGLGTERVEQEVKIIFPNARVARLDRSSTSSFNELQKTLNQMNAGEIDILIGTQMIAKGHDFHKVSLVGVILADTGMAMPDFRAAEKTFQLLSQVAGRSGRGNTPGEVIFQTLNPMHAAIVCAQVHDVDTFIAGEMALRKAEWQPPFCRAALLRLEGKNTEQVRQLCQLVKTELQNFGQKSGQPIDILGPAEAPIARLRAKFRYHIYLRTQNIQSRARVINYIQHHDEIKKCLRSQGVQLVIDVDPINMM